MRSLIDKPAERQFMMTYLLRPSLITIVLIMILFMLAGCGSEQGTSDQEQGVS
ncbi:MAG: hypothetical protein QOI57_3232 [Rubrobacteraceae bacterium]|nr:hypothetical protein [Rubrobacteraceae bacterium]